MEALFDACVQTAPTTVAYQQAMADILAAEEQLAADPDNLAAIAALTDAYAQREREVALSAFQKGFSLAAQLVLSLHSDWHKH